jgi:hypothetical protein
VLIEHFLTEAAFGEAIAAMPSREESARVSESRVRKTVVRGCIVVLSLIMIMIMMMMMICAARFWDFRLQTWEWAVFYRQLGRFISVHTT